MRPQKLSVMIFLALQTICLSAALADPVTENESFHAVGSSQPHVRAAEDTHAKNEQVSHESAHHSDSVAGDTAYESAHHGGHEESHEGGHAGGHNHFAGTFTFVTDEYKTTKANIGGGAAGLSGIGKSEAAPAAAIGINYALGPDKTFGIVLSGDLKKGEYGSYESQSTTVKLDENRHYELAFEPGMVLAPKWLGFLIFGLHQANVTAETSINSVDLNETKNMFGYSVGFGSKLVLADHVFGIFEYQHLKYTNTDISGIRIAPATDAVSLGLGYHF